MTNTRNSVAVSIRDWPIVVDGVAYYVDGNLTVEFDWVDFGIGHYEAWGQTGFDSRMGAEDLRATDLEAVKVTYLTTLLDISAEAEEKIKSALLVKINELIGVDDTFTELIEEQIESQNDER